MKKNKINSKKAEIYHRRRCFLSHIHICKEWSEAQRVVRMASAFAFFELKIYVTLHHTI